MSSIYILLSLRSARDETIAEEAYALETQRALHDELTRLDLCVCR